MAALVLMEGINALICLQDALCFKGSNRVKGQTETLSAVR